MSYQLITVSYWMLGGKLPMATERYWASRGGYWDLSKGVPVYRATNATEPQYLSVDMCFFPDVVHQFKPTDRRCVPLHYIWMSYEHFTNVTEEQVIQFSENDHSLQLCTQVEAP